MTSDVAVAVAAAAAALSIVLLGVVMRQNKLTRTLSTQIADLQSGQAAAASRMEQVDEAGQEAARALQLAVETGAEPTPSNAEDEEDVTVITDISDRLRGIDGDSADLTTARIAAVTLGGPLIKVAAFSHGIRHALEGERRMRISYAVRKELRRQRKIRRRRRADQAPSKGWG